jgi:hypothetical protein
MVQFTANSANNATCRGCGTASSIVWTDVDARTGRFHIVVQALGHESAAHLARYTAIDMPERAAKASVTLLHRFFLPNLRRPRCLLPTSQ